MYGFYATNDYVNAVQIYKQLLSDKLTNFEKDILQDYLTEITVNKFVYTINPEVITLINLFLFIVFDVILIIMLGYYAITGFLCMLIIPFYNGSINSYHSHIAFVMFAKTINHRFNINFNAIMKIRNKIGR